jgi:hypothetical protein
VFLHLLLAPGGLFNQGALKARKHPVPLIVLHRVGARRRRHALFFLDRECQEGTNRCGKARRIARWCDDAAISLRN